MHGYVRLRWGFLDEVLPVAWVHPNDPKLDALKKAALESDSLLQVVAGSAPSWSDPWSRAYLAKVVSSDNRAWNANVVEIASGLVIDDREIQRARIAKCDG